MTENYRQVIADRLFQIEVIVALKLRDMAKKPGHPIGKLVKLANKRKSSRRIAALQDHGVQSLSRIMNVLEEEGIISFPVYGTLLGLVRDGNIIPYDDDVDIAIIKSPEINWIQIDNAFDRLRGQCVRSFSINGRITEKAYAIDGFIVDVFMLYPNETNGLLRSYIYALKEGVFYQHKNERSVWYLDLPNITETVALSVRGYEIHVPKNYDDFLRCVYGPSWMIPDPNWVSGTGWIVLDDVVGIKTTLTDRR